MKHDGTHHRRRWVAAAAALTLIAVGCGSDDESTDSTTAPTEAPSDTSASAATSPTAPEATAATAAAEATAAIVPEVLCVDDVEGEVAFAYDNQNTVAVVLDPSASVVEGAEAADEVFIARVFAPGRVSPAFFQSPTEFGGEVSWTVTGPDGTMATVIADDTTPSCTPELLAPTTPDDREPVLAVTDATLDASGTSVEFATTWTGIPDDSLCATGLEALPPQVTSDIDFGADTADGPDGEWSVELVPVAGTTSGAAYASVAVLVIDQCAADGVTQSVWSDQLLQVYDGVLVCFTVVDGTVDVGIEGVDPECRGLPATGGGRARPG